MELLIALAIGVVGSLIATEIERFFDSHRRKNDRHSPKSGH